LLTDAWVVQDGPQAHLFDATDERGSKNTFVRVLWRLRFTWSKVRGALLAR
jgi:hypothetical protein